MDNSNSQINRLNKQALSFLIFLISSTILVLPIGDLLSLMTGGRLSILFRGGLTLLVICCIFLFRESIKFSAVLVLGVLSSFLVFLISLFYSEVYFSNFNYIELINFTIKIIMPFLCWLIFVELTAYPIKLKLIHKCLFFSLMIYVLAIPLSALLGFDDFKTYGAESNRFGFKGIISAANETSGVLYAAMGIVCLHFIEKPRKVHYISFLFIVFASLLLGTKGGLVGVIILFFGLLYAKKGMLYSLCFGGLCVLFFSIILVFVYFYSDVVQQIVHLSVTYFQYQFENGANGSIINLLLSGRLNKLEEVFIDVESMSFLPLIFGGVDIFSPFVEMDFFDVLFLFGLPLTFYIFFFWFYVFVIKTNYDKRINRFMLVFYLGWFFLSFLAGHFIYSASASLFFIYVSSLASNKELM